MPHLPCAAIDADGHVRERDGELREYLPSPYRDMDWLQTFPFFPTLDGWPRATTSPGKRDDPDAASWLRFLDECGIERTYLYPTAGLGFGLIQDREWAIALARAYNDWLHHRYMRTSPRLIGVALLPIHDVGAAVRELRRAVTELGMPAALLPAANSLGKSFGHPDFRPLFEEAQRLDCALAIHGAPSKGFGFDHFDTFIKTHTLEHPFAVWIQLTSMMFDGVFELFPNLRVAFLECGAGWVPYMMDRFDEEYERRGQRDAPLLKRPPSEYLRGGTIYVSCEVEERTLPYVLEQLGTQQVFFASDYPHEREHSQYLHDLPEFWARSDLSDNAKRGITRDNALRFYGAGATAQAEQPVVAAGGTR
jgi:predicted TIM-barrel fold metal-dependent hydrolase